MATEARSMEYVRTHGYPVPAIEEVRNDGAELVIERIDGPSIVAVMSRRPWSLRPQGAMWADLHCRLHESSGPEWIPPAPAPTVTTSCISTSTHST
jgi:tRNA A-37 threonylcarbamoyl transferase component Bud32